MASDDKRTLFVGALPARRPPAFARASLSLIVCVVRLRPDVGGLEETVTAETLRAAFVPFGEVTDVGLPMEQTTQKHRGFAFVQFESADDALDAIDNMDGAELFGRVLKVNVSKPSAMKAAGNRPVWETDADNFYQHGDKQEVAEEGVERWRKENEP